MQFDDECLYCEIDDLKFMQEWIPVEEDMPKHGKLVLTLNSGGNFGIDYNTTAEKFTADYPCDPSFPVTHWMPLPEPPKGD